MRCRTHDDGPIRATGVDVHRLPRNDDGVVAVDADRRLVNRDRTDGRRLGLGFGGIKPYNFRTIVDITNRRDLDVIRCQQPLERRLVERALSVSELLHDRDDFRRCGLIRLCAGSQRRRWDPEQRNQKQEADSFRHDR